MLRVLPFLCCAAILMAVVIGCGDSEAEVATNGGNSNGGDSGNEPAAPEVPGGGGADPMSSSDGATDPGGMGMGTDPGMDTGDPMGAGFPGAEDPAGFGGNGNQSASKLPESVSDWKPDDFRNAARSSDARLKPAVEELVAKTPGDQQTAELLVELLTLIGKSSNGNNGGFGDPGMPGDAAGPMPGDASIPADPAATADLATDDVEDPAVPMPGIDPMPGADPMPGGFPGQFGQQNGGNRAELVRAVIDGLAKNGTPPAWQALEEVLAGEIKTSVGEREVTDWVLAAALDNYGGSGHPAHAFLERVIKFPKQISASRGEELRRQVSEMIAGTAAAVLDRLMGVPEPAGPRRPQQPGGMGPGGMGPGGDPMAGGDPEFAGGPMPGAAPGLQGGNGARPQSSFRTNRRPLTDEGMRNAIRYLWQADNLSSIEETTRSLPSLKDGIGTLALAGSLPTQGMREATFEFMNGRWKDGADPLLAAGIYQSVVRDPGLIVVLKQMPRLMPSGVQKNQQTSYANPRVSKSQRESIAKQSWMKLSAMMVRAVTERLRASTPDGGTVSPPALPIKLHRDAQIRGVRTFTWPDDIADLASGATPPGSLSVQYVRMDAPQDIPRAFEFYKRQLKRGKAYKFPMGAWIDSIAMGSKPGTRRSIDVLITQNSPANGIGPNGNPGPGGASGDPAGFGGGDPMNQGFGAAQQQAGPQFTLEILVVEISDPKRPAPR